MRYIRNTTEFSIERESVLSLGKCDGIHRGHELLLERLAEKKEQGLVSVVFTFDIPPRQSIDGAEAKVLTTNEEKVHRLERIGVDCLVECPFTEESRCMDAAVFLEKIVRQLHVKCMVVGEDFRFGHNRGGDYRLLRQYAGRYGYEVCVIPKMKEDARDISSTYVREEIARGNIEKANRLLGYRYYVTSVVGHGNQIGRTIGIPTINQVPPPEKLLPPNGVYVTEVYIDEQKYRGITNVGCKPTIEGKHPVGVETHLLDFCGDVYDKLVTVEFICPVRRERKFDSVDALRAQMQDDIAFGRAYFSNDRNIT